MQMPTDFEWTHLITGVSGQEKSSAARLLHRAKRLALIENKVLSAIPLPEREHCSLSNIRPSPSPSTGYELVLIVSSAAWASRLRFHDETIKTNLSTDETAINSVKIVVRQADTNRPKPKSDPIRSAKGARTLSAASAQIEHDALAAALDKLAKTIEPDQ